MIRFSGVLAGLLFVLSVAAAEIAPPRTAPSDSEVAPKAESPAVPAAEGSAGARAPFYVLVDHLSPALYEGESLTACLRIENTTDRDADAVLRVEVLSSGEKGRSEDARTLRIGAHGQSSCRFDIALEGVQRVRFILKSAHGEVNGPCVQVLHSGDPWPETNTLDGRLVEVSSGRVLLPVVARCERKEERSFAPLSWLVPEEGAVRKEARRGYLFLPDEWVGTARADHAREIVPQKSYNAKTWERLGPYPLSGVAPILLAIGDCARGLPQPAPDRVVVLLPAEDLDAATDPRLFRIAVEVLLARLERAGVKEIVLSTPMVYGVSVDRVERLEQAAKEAIKGRPARLFDRQGLLEELLWRLDPKTPGVYGRCPNEAGRKKIKQALADLVL